MMAPTLGRTRALVLGTSLSPTARLRPARYGARDAPRLMFVRRADTGGIDRGAGRHEPRGRPSGASIMYSGSGRLSWAPRCTLSEPAFACGDCAAGLCAAAQVGSGVLST